MYAFQAMIKIVVSHGWGVFGYFLCQTGRPPKDNRSIVMTLEKASLSCNCKNKILTVGALSVMLNQSLIIGNKAMHLLHSAAFPVFVPKHFSNFVLLI